MRSEIKQILYISYHICSVKIAERYERAVSKGLVPGESDILRVYSGCLTLFDPTLT